MSPTVESFAENVTVVNGRSVRAVGPPFPTHVIVVKLLHGSLWANSRFR